LKLSKNKEILKIEVTLKLLQLKLNIINKPKTKRTELESLEESKPTVVSFTTLHKLLDTIFSPKVNPLLKEKMKRKKRRSFHIPLPNPTKKRNNLLSKYSRP
jgi:hypothetical protein